MTDLIAHIAQLWRYPVKSMRGESCATLDVTPTGIAGDRRFALTSSRAPVGAPLLHSTERAAMLLFQPHTAPDGRLTITTPEGPTLPLEDPALLRHIEAHLAEPTSLALRHSEAPQTDVRPIALHSLQTTRHLATALTPDFPAERTDLRLRSNILLALTSAIPFDEDHLSGRTLRLGPSVILRITERIPRCRIVALDPTTAVPDRTILTHLARHHSARAGIYATVLTPGPICIGDPVFVEPYAD